MAALTTQYLSGVVSAYINGVMVPTAEEVTIKSPRELYKYAESNSGPQSNILTWSKEQGNIALTFLHYSGLDYQDLFSESLYEVVINLRSGDQYVGHNCILAELPSDTGVAATTEVQFNTMSIEFTPAS